MVDKSILLNHYNSYDIYGLKPIEMEVFYMQRTVDVTTARRQFGTLLDEVFYKGDVITIEGKGKPQSNFIYSKTRY